MTNLVSTKTPQVQTLITVFSWRVSSLSKIFYLCCRNSIKCFAATKNWDLVGRCGREGVVWHLHNLTLCLRKTKVLSIWKLICKEALGGSCCPARNKWRCTVEAWLPQGTPLGSISFQRWVWSFPRMIGSSRLKAERGGSSIPGSSCNSNGGRVLSALCQDEFTLDFCYFEAFVYTLKFWQGNIPQSSISSSVFYFLKTFGNFWRFVF